MENELEQLRKYEATLRYGVLPKRDQLGMLVVVDKQDQKVAMRCKSTTKAEEFILKQQVAFEQACKAVEVTTEVGLQMSKQDFEQKLRNLG